MLNVHKRTRNLKINTIYSTVLDTSIYLHCIYIRYISILCCTRYAAISLLRRELNNKDDNLEVLLIKLPLVRLNLVIDSF